MRTHYRNGNPIGLESTGCDDCCPALINGVFCHETGCAAAWQDYTVKCFECGYDFYPEDRHQKTCADCLDSADGDYPD